MSYKIVWMRPEHFLTKSQCDSTIWSVFFILLCGGKTMLSQFEHFLLMEHACPYKLQF